MATVTGGLFGYGSRNVGFTMDLAYLTVSWREKTSLKNMMMEGWRSYLNDQSICGSGPFWTKSIWASSCDRYRTRKTGPEGLTQASMMCPYKWNLYKLMIYRYSPITKSYRETVKRGGITQAIVCPILDRSWLWLSFIRLGGFLKWGCPQIIQLMDDHFY